MPKLNRGGSSRLSTNETNLIEEALKLTRIIQYEEKAISEHIARLKVVADQLDCIRRRKERRNANP